MRFSLSLLAVSVGTIIALSPLHSASAQSPARLGGLDGKDEVEHENSIGAIATTLDSAATVEVAQADEAAQPENDSESEAIVVETEPAAETEPTAASDQSNADADAESAEPTEQPGNAEEPSNASTSPDDASADESEREITPETSSETASEEVSEQLSQDLPAGDETEETSPAPSLDSSDEAAPPEDEAEVDDEAEAEAEAEAETADENLIQAAPEYLNPSPNPLQFPTQPEEVEIVGTQPITLEQAIDLAVRNNRELQVSRLELERAQAALREVQANNLPTVDLNSNLTFQENTQQQDSGALQDFLDQLQGGQGGSGQSDEDDVNVVLGGAVELNYTLFTGGRRPALIEAAEGQVRFQELQVEAQEEQLRLDVINNYYDLQETDEQVRIQESALEQALQSLRDAEALERAGVGTRFDVLQAQVDVANARQQLTQALSQRQIARRQIVQTLSLAQSVEVAAADPVEVADLWDLSLEETIVLAIRNRAELEQQLVQREVSDAQRRAALAQLRPQIGLFASYNVQDTLNEDQTVQDNYQFGAQFNLSLFDGGAARAQAAQEEANIAIAETNFAAQRNQIRFDVESAYSNLQANFENIQTASLALEQAREALRLARLRFQAGVGTQTDVLIAQSDLTEAEFNRVQAILGYNRSLAELQRSVSNFPYAGVIPEPSPQVQ
ncbi:TolC family protein [Leptolyngbya sp. FACHB-671]|uniref:TolC family protein n=1 Tax=Leptolyngbya sp. FACHB-671 TaxID=2692812 RepID=UPI001687CADE|nr:TolC family protein [Leptolyngbya sp. FACHB-671]MBD2068122.1 TolC family protein [Leptolyngbya sp. FACHB-671]